jgi:hypothetical protein
MGIRGATGTWRTPGALRTRTGAIFEVVRMTGLVVTLAALPVLIAAGLIALSAGFRAGDQPADVRVTAVIGPEKTAASVRPGG